MNKRSRKSFIFQVLGMENESKWLHSEKVNIFITAFIPTFVGLITSFISFFDETPENSLKKLLMSDVFINSMQLVVIACTLFVIFRIRRKILVTTMMGQRLSSYIKEKCNLRDHSEGNVKYFMLIIGKTMKHFYYAWIALWTVFFVYYSGSLCFVLLNSFQFENYHYDVAQLIINGYNNFFNYLSSTAMFMIFIILNSPTVKVKDRRNRRGLIYGIFLIVIFGCLILLPTIFSFSLFGMSYFKLQLLITIVLGFYSAFSFVLFLGKLNSNSNLNTPRFIFYGLYIYALVQMFQFLFTFTIVKDYCWGTFVEFIVYLNKVEIIFKYITLIGKVCLSLTLLWIVFDSKIIYHVIQESQANTEMEYRKDVFDTYMKDIS